MLILKKGNKSLFTLQSELFKELGKSTKLTAGALTKAKKKVSHRAFIELNNAILKVVYDGSDYRKWYNFRLLAVDGTEAILPKTQEIKEHFGTRKLANQSKQNLGEYTTSKISVLYDVCNQLTVNAVMGECNADEKKLFYEHQLEHLRQDDLLLADRFYPGYRFLAELYQRKINFALRCSTQSFKKAIELHNSKRTDCFSVLTTLKPTKDITQIRELGLPQQIRVRFVYISRESNDPMVIVTSLLDKEVFKDQIFLELYFKRWSIENSNDRYKNKLHLENFTGSSVEIVKQDFFSVVFIANLEAILISSAQDILDAKNTKQPQRVNHAHAFYIVKEHILDLFFFKRKRFHKLFQKLTNLFLKDPVSCQHKQNLHNHKKPLGRVVNYLKYKKKVSF